MARSKKEEVSTEKKTKTKAKIPKHKMSQEDKDDWDALYEFVRTNILGYDKAQSLSSKMVLRLKGLLTSKFMENTNTQDMSNYSYKTILNTFKFCMRDIQKCLRDNSFKDENHKFNYILKIVEDKINTVYIREKNARIAKEELVNQDMTETVNYVNKFKVNEDVGSCKKYDDLW